MDNDSAGASLCKDRQERLQAKEKPVVKTFTTGFSFAPDRQILPATYLGTGSRCGHS
jgi:hypothetical protein